MTGNGIVREIKGNLVRLQYCSDADCESCGSCGKLFERRGRPLVEAGRPENLQVNLGDIVEIYLSPWKAIKAGFMILMLPLILFLLFYFAGSGWLLAGNESGSLLLGTAGIALGFLINLVLKLKSKQQELPMILRVVQDNNSESGKEEQMGEKRPSYEK